MAHTPGPWEAKRLTDGDGEPYETLYMAHIDIEGVCMVWAPVGHSEQEANAKLIAAAPELLEALKEVVAISDRKHDAWDKAKLAISKAEGK